MSDKKALKAALTSAKKNLNQKNLDAALQDCKKAFDIDREAYMVHLMFGAVFTASEEVRPRFSEALKPYTKRRL